MTNVLLLLQIRIYTNLRYCCNATGLWAGTCLVKADID